jgi:predicted ester cyclase
MPPTGREVRVSGVQFSRVENGKFVEGRGLFDALSHMQQLGAIPVGAPTGARA